MAVHDGDRTHALAGGVGEKEEDCDQGEECAEAKDCGQGCLLPEYGSVEAAFTSTSDIFAPRIRQ